MFSTVWYGLLYAFFLYLLSDIVILYLSCVGLYRKYRNRGEPKIGLKTYALFMNACALRLFSVVEFTNGLLQVDDLHLIWNAFGAVIAVLISFIIPTVGFFYALSEIIDKLFLNENTVERKRDCFSLKCMVILLGVIFLVVFQFVKKSERLLFLIAFCDASTLIPQIFYVFKYKVYTEKNKIVFLSLLAHYFWRGVSIIAAYFYTSVVDYPIFMNYAILIAGASITALTNSYFMENYPSQEPRPVPPFQIPRVRAIRVGEAIRVNESIVVPPM